MTIVSTQNISAAGSQLLPQTRVLNAEQVSTAEVSRSVPIGPQASQAAARLTATSLQSDKERGGPSSEPRTEGGYADQELEGGERKESGEGKRTGGKVNVEA